MKRDMLFELVRLFLAVEPVEAVDRSVFLHEDAALRAALRASSARAAAWCAWGSSRPVGAGFMTTHAARDLARNAFALRSRLRQRGRGAGAYS